MFHSKILKSGNTINAVPRSIFLTSQFLNNDHDMARKMFFLIYYFFYQIEISEILSSKTDLLSF